MESGEIERAARDLLSAQKAIAFTGAGISVESGIPDFRSPTGLWSKYDPDQYATIDAFKADPGKVWEMLVEMIGLVTRAKPNPAHHGLASLETMGRLHAVVTQNIDGLHQAAGSRKVIEIHGSGASLSCLSCGSRIAATSFSMEKLPPRCPECRSIMKPDVVFFGEPLPLSAYEAALEAARECDLVLAIGTSAEVYPAAEIPITAKRAGAKLVEINVEPTSLTGRFSDYLIQGRSGEILPRVVELVRGLMYQ
ncbi:MAG: NAD-dependent deacylase [Deltaproteobacteria bacterium]|nr:NAD-dependent deacylase [Deltaproteobacteria bacterium]MBW2123643.1 NAD-dependent deacylase [Deltaproteobacteria bacterium]